VLELVADATRYGRNDKNMWLELRNNDTFPRMM
jgi:hypothetical protein